jgi:Domain of unknown function (DUF4082)
VPTRTPVVDSTRGKYGRNRRSRRERRRFRARARARSRLVRIVSMVTISVLAITSWAVASNRNIGGSARGHEYGVQFAPKVPGVVEGVVFYYDQRASSDLTASLWSADGALLARAEQSRTVGGGWHLADFPKPVTVDPAVSYVVSFWSPGKRQTTNSDFLRPPPPGYNSSEIEVEASFMGNGSGFPDHEVRAHRALVLPIFRHVTTSPDPIVTAQPTPTGSATPTPTESPTSTPTNSSTPSSSPPPSSSPTPAPINPPLTGFPNASNTGVPTGTALSAYTGQCTITTANTVIDAKNVSCGLQIRAPGVKITRSKVGGVTVPIGSGGSVTITDSEIIASANSTAVGDVNFNVERSNIWGGNRGVYCYDNCTVRDSFIHGTRYTGDAHASGMRAGQRTTYEHNTIWCDAQDNSQGGGCSADLTMYGDFTTVQYVTIRNNLFKATPGGFCGYGGSTKSKPYPNAHHIVFDGNVFERGSGGKCGYWGAVTDFSPSSTGNQWTNNIWDDGSVAKPS